MARWMMIVAVAMLASSSSLIEPTRGWAAPTAPDQGDAPAKTLDLQLSDDVTMKLVLVPKGRFVMGSSVKESGRERDEGPQRRVTISRPYYMGIYEVTQQQYEAVTGANPSSFKGEDRPVESVSWNDAVAFCKKLSEKTGRTVRLPTEAEWEYACRAGTTTRYSFGDRDAELHKYGNYADKSSEGLFHADKAHDDGHAKTAPVGSYKPNAFGLYDMHGNVAELCADFYQKSYRGLADKDPTGPKTGTYGEQHVMRGGSWPDPARFCRSADRNFRKPDAKFIFFGFRVVVEAE